MNARDAINEWIDGTLSGGDLEQSLNAATTTEELEEVTDLLLLHSLLEDEFSSEATGDLLDLVGGSIGEATVLRRPIPRFVRWRRAILVACALVIAVGSFALFQRSATAAPSEVLKTALRTHGQSLERVYAIGVVRSGASSMPSTIGRTATVNTQGNRYWVAVKNDGNQWAWGREQDGSVWLAIGPNAAMRITPDEIGEPLESLLEPYSLNVESLLDHFLRDCDLETSPGDQMTHVIEARGRTGARKRSHQIRASIEIDKETKAIRKLALVRENDRQTREVTFTLTATRPVQEDKYTLKGHIDSAAHIVDGPESRDARRRVLVRRFGRQAGRWIVDP